MRIGGIFIWVIFCWFAFPECVLGEEPETSENKINLESLKKIMYETNHTKRREKLEEFIGDNPKGRLTDDALLQLAEEHHRGIHLYENVIQICDKIIADFPQATLEFTKPLEELMWCGHDHPSIRQVMNHLNKYPDLTSDHALRLKAEALFRLGEKEEGKKCLWTLIKKHPNGLYEKEDTALEFEARFVMRPHQTTMKDLIKDVLEQGKMEEVWQLYVDYYSKWYNKSKAHFSRNLAKQFAVKEQFKKAVHIMNDVVRIIKKKIETFPEERPDGYNILLYFDGGAGPVAMPGTGPRKEGETDWEHFRRESIEALKKSLAEVESELKEYSQGKKE